MIETEQQRRWWFATHQEFSHSRRGDGNNQRSAMEEDSDKVSPKSVDAYVNRTLKYKTDNVDI